MIDKFEKFLEYKYSALIVFLSAFALGGLGGVVSALVQGWRP